MNRGLDTRYIAKCVGKAIGRLGGHDVIVGDVDGDLDLTSKIWSRWAGNSNAGREHADFLENPLR